MNAKVLEAEEFFHTVITNSASLIDTRSESEYEKAHIPGAVNLPILNNEERKEVGTLYKQKGRGAAVSKGFELVGSRFHKIIDTAIARFEIREVYIYCWRGGMRSAILGWLLTMAGFKVTLLKGGYKSFRNLILNSFSLPRNIVVIGGQTGSGKTEILQRLKESGEQILDLEGLAHHKGSAFGALGQLPQPSNEQFENLIGLQWLQLDPDRCIWIENESRNIGSCTLPAPIFILIRDSLLVEVHVPLESRKTRIKSEYGIFSTEELSTCTKKIGKRLGPLLLKEALLNLEEGHFDEWLDIVLAYYDKLYSYGTEQRKPELVVKLDTNTGDPLNIADQLIHLKLQYSITNEQ